MWNFVAFIGHRMKLDTREATVAAETIVKVKVAYMISINR